MDDELRALLARRKRANRGPGVGVALAAGAGAVALAAAGYLLLAGRAGSGRAADWTHRELAAHLETRGLKYTMAEARRLGAAYLCDHADTAADVAAADGGVLLPGVVRFTRAPTEGAARAWEGETPPGSAVFRWGAWVFEGDRDMLAAIRRVLR